MEKNKIHVEIKKELVTADGKRFLPKQDIAFNILNKETGHLDCVICRIMIIQESDYYNKDGFILVDKIEINRCFKENEQHIYYFKDMQDINYVYDD